MFQKAGVVGVADMRALPSSHTFIQETERTGIATIKHAASIPCQLAALDFASSSQWQE
jgi:hypothetical protein